MIIWKPWYQAEAEDVMEKESSVQDRILSPIASRATTPLNQRERGSGIAPFGRQFSMARMAARIRRPRRWWASVARFCFMSGLDDVVTTK